MGYMTVISFLNDAEDQVKKNPERLAEIVSQAMMGINSEEHLGGRKKLIQNYGIGNHCNPINSLKPQHADVPLLCLAYQNMLLPIGYNNKNYNDQVDVRIRKESLQIIKRLIKEEEKIIKQLEEQESGDNA